MTANPRDVIRHQPAMQVAHPKAFTLIELLVVIAIIAILMAILMPSLAAARTQARMTACRANLHSFGIAAMNYCAEYDGVLIPSYPQIDAVGVNSYNDNRWWILMKRIGYLGVANPNFFYYSVGNDRLMAKTLRCPLYAGSYFAQDHVSYSMNTFFGGSAVKGGGNYPPGKTPPEDASWARRKIVEVSNPSIGIYIGEGSVQMQTSANPAYAGLGSKSVNLAPVLATTSTYDAPDIIHTGNKMGTLFLDWHVEDMVKNTQLLSNITFPSPDPNAVIFRNQWVDWNPTERR